MEFKNKDKTLLILDLDETLIYGTKKELDRTADFMVYDYYIYKRPNLLEFIKKIKEDYLLGVWSSASDDYVNAITNKIFSDPKELEFIWGRSRCTYRRNNRIDEFGYYDADQQNHYHYIKPLKKLKKKGYILERILIVDDTPHKSKDNYGNAIYPKMYQGEENDVELIYLQKYLEILKTESNVRKLEKRGWRNRIIEK